MVTILPTLPSCAQCSWSPSSRRSRPSGSRTPSLSRSATPRYALTPPHLSRSFTASHHTFASRPLVRSHSLAPAPLITPSHRTPLLQEAPAGLIPPFKTGLTAEAELINGRLAMLGLIAIVMVRPTPIFVSSLSQYPLSLVVPARPISAPRLFDASSPSSW